MKKIFVGTGLFIIAIIAWIGFSMDGRIKNHIEETATYLAGVPVSIQSVDISILKGTGAITGLEVANPKGYSNGNAFEIFSIRFDIESGTFFNQPLVVNNLEFEAPLVNLEFKEDFQSNLQDIVNVSNKQNKVGEKRRKSSGAQETDSEPVELPTANKQVSDSEPTGKDEKPDDDDFRMVVRRLNIEEITVNAQRGEDKWSDSLSGVKMKNLGKEKGIGTRELGIIIVRELTNKTLEQAARRKLADIVEEKVKDIGDKLLKSLLNE